MKIEIGKTVNKIHIIEAGDSGALVISDMHVVGIQIVLNGARLLYVSHAGYCDECGEITIYKLIEPITGFMVYKFDEELSCQARLASMHRFAKTKGEIDGQVKKLLPQFKKAGIKTPVNKWSKE